MKNELHEKVFLFLEDFRKENPDFIYFLRQRGERLNEGCWFQGEHYAAVGLYYGDSGNRSTRSITLIFDLDGDNITWRLELLFKSEEDERKLDLYETIAEDLKMHQPEDNDVYFTKAYDDNSLQSVADFLKNEKPLIDALIVDAELEDEFFIEEDKFETMINRINEYRKKGNERPLSSKNPDDSESDKKIPLNQILYGPPGTGKTYNTINKAIKIANPEFDLNQERAIIKAEFDRLQDEGRIVFTTFHQSMTYEDFVEGIKPVSPEEDGEQTQVTYEVQSGIFKNICNQARVVKGKKVKIDFEKVDFHKMSLGGKGRPDIHEWCIANNKLALGYGGESDLSALKKIDNRIQFRDLFKKMHPELHRIHIQTAYAFVHMKPGDIVVVSKGNHIIDAIGRIKGEYHYDDSNSVDYFHFREVEWLATDMGASPEKFIKKNISQLTIYTFYNTDIKLEAFRELTGGEKEEEKNYVLIIDEINRGNVSQIFGELITLIESDKRQGKAEALELTLPYSKTKFGVPPNLHIIGTMNTADRSVEALDAALRRRFHFTEMPPVAQIIRDKGVDEIGEFNTADILETINNRIKILLDRDHLIGHSYFLKIKNMEDLRRVFVDRIIPLLQEYFYGDYSKIALVLGKGFCDIDEQLNKYDFAPDLDEFSENYDERKVFTLQKIESTEDFIAALKKMVKPKKETDEEQ